MVIQGVMETWVGGREGGIFIIQFFMESCVEEEKSVGLLWQEMRWVVTDVIPFALWCL